MRIGIILLLLSPVAYYYWYKIDKENKLPTGCCAYTEIIARRIASSLAEYYAHPENTDLISFEELNVHASNSLTDEKFEYTGTITGTADDPVITVIPDPKRCTCYFGVKYVLYPGGVGEDGWLDEFGNRSVK